MAVDRRSLPRYPLLFPVQVDVGADDGALTFNAESINLSRTSIEISCDNVLVENLRKQDDYPHTCQLSFELPDQSNLLEMDAQVVTHRRISQKIYRLILTFPGLSLNEKDFLSEYLKALQNESSNNDASEI